MSDWERQICLLQQRNERVYSPRRGALRMTLIATDIKLRFAKHCKVLSGKAMEASQDVEN